MLLAAALALTSVLSPVHHHPSQVTRHKYVTGGWSLTVDRDNFTSALSCSLKTRTMHYRNGTLIFHLKNGVETTHAFYRLDDGPAAPVSVAFHDVETRGLLSPSRVASTTRRRRRGAAGVLVRSAGRVAIRASTRMRAECSW